MSKLSAGQFAVEHLDALTRAPKPEPARAHFQGIPKSAVVYTPAQRKARAVLRAEHGSLRAAKANGIDVSGAGFVSDKPLPEPKGR